MKRTLLTFAPFLCAALLAVPMHASAAAVRPVPFIDMNNNGVFDSGDIDVSAQLDGDGVVATSESIVIPAGSGSFVNRAYGFTLSAGKNITINAALVAQGATIEARTDGGSITVGPRARLTASAIQLTAEGDVVLGAQSGLSARDGYLMVESIDGSVLADAGVQLSGADRVEINTYANGGAKLDGAVFTTPRGLLNLHVGGDVSMVGAKLNAGDVTVSSDGHLIDFRSAYVHAARDGYVFVSVAGSTVDCTGARWAMSEDNLVFDAQNVIGYK